MPLGSGRGDCTTSVKVPAVSTGTATATALGRIWTARRAAATLKVYAMRTIDAVIDADGHVELQGPVALTGRHRAVVLILDEDDVRTDARLSEAALARDWNRPDEDEAWASFQPET